MVPNIMSIRAILSVAVIAGTTLSACFLGKTPAMVLGIFIASLGLLLFAFQGPLDSTLIAIERLDLSSLFNLLQQLTFVVAGTLALLAGTGYIGLLVAFLAGILVLGATSFLGMRRALGLALEAPRPRVWPSLLRASMPFAVVGVIADATPRFATVFMSFVLTYTAVGIFNVPYNLILMMLLLAQALALAMYPSLVKEFHHDRGSLQDTVHRALRYMLILSLPVAIGGSLLARRILVVLYGPSFSAAVPALQIMLWGLPCMFLSEILGRVAYAMNLERKAATVIVINAVTTVLLDLVLIPLWGVEGAASAFLVGRILNVVLAVVIIGPTFILSGSGKPMLRIAMAGVVMGVPVWALSSGQLLAAVSPETSLALLIGLGASVYGCAALMLQAVTPGEARYLQLAATRRLGLLRVMRS
jgi:O-antigen/teichoic acid export membrane protein